MPDLFEQSILNSSDPMAFGEFSVEDRVEDLTIRYANRAFSELFNIPMDQLLGMKLVDLRGPERTAYLLNRFQQITDSGKPAEFKESITADDRTITQLQQVTPLENGILVRVRDISKTEAEHEALIESQAYLASVIRNVPLILYEFDKQGNFTLSEGSSLANIGLKPGEAIGRSLFDYFSADSEEVRSFYRALQGETVSMASMLEGIHFMTAYSPRFDEHGDIVGVLGVSYDITEQKNAEQHLFQAQKMEAMGRLTGGVAHDFNNLLVVIMGNLELFQLDDIPSNLKPLIDDIQDAAMRASDLTRRLLSFSSRQIVEPQRLEVNEELKSLIGMLRRMLPEHIDIVFETSLDPAMVNVDKSQFENSLLNLAVNARDVMPDGGRLLFSVSGKTLRESEAEAMELSQTEFVEIAVVDDGPGVPDELQTTIFDPFFTTKEEGKGTGLGLSMVFGFTRIANGRISVTNQSGGGARFSVLLPLASGTAEARKRPIESSGGSEGNGEKVLVVEDAADIRRLVSPALLGMNYEVIEAETGDEALQLLDEHNDIKVLFTDVIMPGETNGLQLARHVRQHRPDISILVTTGYATEDTEDFFVLRKPYTPGDLAGLLRDLIDNKPLTLP